MARRRRTVRTAARVVSASRVGRVVAHGNRARRLGPRRPPERDWRVAEDGRAPRLSSREYIGHDVQGIGPWAERDPLRVPRLWTLASWGGLVGWLAAVGGSGWIAWRRHGGIDGANRDDA